MCAVETNALELHVCNFEHSSVPSAAIFVQGSEGIFFSMGGQKERGKQKGKDGLEQGQKGSNCGLEEGQKSGARERKRRFAKRPKQRSHGNRWPGTRPRKCPV